MTLEDPIEYGLDGISQTQMHHKVGLTFAATLARDPSARSGRRDGR